MATATPDVTTEKDVSADADVIFADWLDRFGEALTSNDLSAVGEFFDEDGYWKDILSLTSGYRFFHGPSEIEQNLADNLREAGLKDVRVADGRAAPSHLRRADRAVIEAYFDFETAVGHGTGFVRLLHNHDDPMDPKIWLLLTTLQELRGFEEKVGERRPSGTKYSRSFAGDNWLDERRKEQAFADRDPEVVVVGGAQSGVILAARLKQMDVDTLVVEKLPRVGDNWRNRYHSLTLHNEVWSNHLPYVPFPETWPRFLPKDMLAMWLEAYADFMELNVWTSTEFVGGEYDEQTETWSIDLRQADGSMKEMRSSHLVMATGGVSGVPNTPSIEGLERFEGPVMHSKQYSKGAHYAGQNAIVVGTGNSGHDVAQDLYSNGAASVTMVQNSPTCVVSLEPSAAMMYGLYSENKSVEDADLIGAAIPYPVQKDIFQHMSRKMRKLDSDLIEGLEAAGFQTHYGRDDTGFLMLYFRRGGGYYINVGCSELIAEGEIDVVQTDDIETFHEDGIRLNDGSEIPGDLVVLATGYENQQEEIRQLLGDEVADRVGPVWGLNDHQMQRNVAQQTPQPGFWIMTGDLVYCRFYSRFLALQIKAAQEGISMEPGSPPHP